MVPSPAVTWPAQQPPDSSHLTSRSARQQPCQGQALVTGIEGPWGQPLAAVGKRLRPQSSQQPLWSTARLANSLASQQPGSSTTAWLANSLAGQQPGWPVACLASSTSGLCSVGPACHQVPAPFHTITEQPGRVSLPAMQHLANSKAQLQPSFSLALVVLWPSFSPASAQLQSSCRSACVKTQPRSNLQVSHAHTTWCHLAG